LMDTAQRAVLWLWHALGLTSESHGQPAWPWGSRLVGDNLLIDFGLARQVAASLIAVSVIAMLAVIGLVWRRRRAVVFATSMTALIVLFTPWPSPRLLTGAAGPTSFHRHPEPFSVETITRGARVYGAHCSACHGDDGRGEEPRAASLPTWPPTLVGPLLGRRADGELFRHVLDGMRDTQGNVTMPGFHARLADADIWDALDYAQALAAGTGAAVNGSWPLPLRLPALELRCDDGAPQSLDQWRGRQRVRVVAVEETGADAAKATADAKANANAHALPIEDPRFLTLLLTRDGKLPAGGDRFRARCVATSPDAWSVFARMAGVLPADLGGTGLLADARGWLRARGQPGQAAWTDRDLLCASAENPDKGRIVDTDTDADADTRIATDGLTALLLRMDAEPVRFVKGGVAH
jgi:mono/diheme cytochrome c family protein